MIGMVLGTAAREFRSPGHIVLHEKARERDSLPPSVLGGYGVITLKGLFCITTTGETGG